MSVTPLSGFDPKFVNSLVNNDEKLSAAPAPIDLGQTDLGVVAPVKISGSQNVPAPISSPGGEPAVRTPSVPYEKAPVSAPINTSSFGGLGASAGMAFGGPVGGAVGGIAGMGIDFLLAAEERDRQREELAVQIKREENNAVRSMLISSNDKLRQQGIQDSDRSENARARKYAERRDKLNDLRSAVMNSRTGKKAMLDSWVERGY